MATDVLSRVQKAEQEAEQIRQQAAAEARDIIKAVEEASLAESRDGAAQSREQAGKLLQRAKEAAQGEIDALAAKEAARREQQKVQARERLDQAASLIYERIVRNGDR